MSSFNRIAMAILLALVVVKGADLIADMLVHPKMLEKNVYIVEGLEVVQPTLSEAQGPDLEPIEPLLAKASVENGMQIARRCLQCHSFEKGGPTKTGPNLYNVVGNKTANLDGYAYSSGLANLKKTWTYENLNAFLHKPRNVVAGTKMSFAGLNKVQDRADIIAYMRTLSDAPQPLPQ